jgi:methyl-accepting chemotaxis protein
MLAHVRIVGKLALLMGGSGLVLAGVAAVGLWGIAALKEDVAQVHARGSSALLATRMNQDIIQLGRIEFRLAASPTVQAVADARREIAEEQAEFRQRFEQSLAIAGAERRVALERVRAAHAAYSSAIDRTLSAADAASNGRGEAASVLAAAHGNRTAYEAARTAARDLDDTAIRLAGEAAAGAQRGGDFITNLMLAMAVFGIVGSILLGWLIGARGLSRPIVTSVQRLRALSEGDTDSAVTGAERKDEVGDIARTMAVFRENLLAAREAQSRELREAEAKAARARKVEEITSAFEAQTGEVVRTVAAAATEMETTASGMAQGAESTAQQASSVAAAAEQAAANVQTVAAAAEELAASVGEISRQVAESTRIAEEATGEATRTSEAVRTLSDNAQKISDVVRLISEIAGQTNLLALNATIEAARAGEAGKGFAVVASEVKNLAAQTGKATEEIAGQVTAVQSETARVVEAIQGMSTVITRLSQIAASIAAAVEEQGAATGEIARNVQEAAAGTGAVTQNIASVNRTAKTSGAAATQVQAAARELNRNAETLRGQVDAFLGQMKAA